eukprot:CAMPEP_0119016626 /NCGR_PEP_ID=MMETSP1176-20130426/13873_1 /TAXON_ID=265551 /ORGANISM="Synedropsis recta cf, Strain CCMP1620" /LENGTH=561 /DNA_ID=CAMNT_0006970113 /DNA_START=176 /DNA_END=1861 /DNA_ORIENTATION=+
MTTDLLSYPTNTGTTSQQQPLLDASSNDEAKESHKNKIKNRFLDELEAWEKKSPLLKKFTNQVRRIPPSLRVAFIIGWVLWKFVLLFVAIRVFWWGAAKTVGNHRGRGTSVGAVTPHFGDNEEAPTKVLYIVTSLAEFDNGLRATKKGRDRFQELMVPTIVDSIETMVSHPYDFEVDLHLITAYTLKPERIQYLQDLLPNGVGLETWDDACPLGYDKRHDEKHVLDVTRALARQHRYVMKDKMHHYDVFLPFEDDMRITGAHVQHYLDMSTELEHLAHDAPHTMSDVPESEDPKKMKFFGKMTQDQMKRLVPGLIRVEVLVDEAEHGAQNKLGPIEVDFDIDGVETHIDPSICCHVPNLQPNVGIPVRPDAADVVIWETRAEALSFRHIPDSKLFDWTILMPGPGKREDPSEKVMGYWSGRSGAFGDMKKPSGGVPDLIAQQGGWMATREQVIRLDEELCAGVFLPPFDAPMYYEDGQQSMNVEYWSGGYQYFTGVRGGCNMQRVISWKDFSKHLIYHVANNKQKQLTSDRMLRADHLFAQMNTVQKKAQAAMESITEHQH